MSTKKPLELDVKWETSTDVPATQKIAWQNLWKKRFDHLLKEETGLKNKDGEGKRNAEQGHGKLSADRERGQAD